MVFKIIDRKTGREPTGEVIHDIAKEGGLMEMDIDQFAVCEDGTILLLDDCERVAYCDTRRFKVQIESEEV